MKRHLSWLAAAALLAGSFSPSAFAQKSDRDPLSEAEIDQMREASDYPSKRLELMASFARARLAKIDQLRAATEAAATRPKEIHDLLQDFITLMDETDDNIDMYASHNADMRKGLKLVIEADSEFQLHLRQIKEQSQPAELEQYSFALTNAIETVGDSSKTSREALEEQNKLAAEKKLVKDYTLRKD